MATRRNRGQRGVVEEVGGVEGDRGLGGVETGAFPGLDLRRVELGHQWRRGRRPDQSALLVDEGARGVAAIDGVRAIVTVDGEVDIATAPTLGGLLETLVDHGHTELVLELEALQFLDASGVGVLARGLALLRPHQGTLRLRSVPAPTERVLRLTGFSDLIDADAPSEERSERAAASGDPAAGKGVHLRLGALPTSNDTIDAALRLVVTLASATVRGADGVSVSLHRHGRLMTAAASDETVLEMDHNQYDTGEGPCLSAAAEGRCFRVDALAEEERWPAFTPRAIKRGSPAPCRRRS